MRQLKRTIITSRCCDCSLEWLSPLSRSFGSTRSEADLSQMAVESWRMSRTELRGLLNSYEKAVEDDAFHFLRPSVLERRFLGETLLKKRAEAIKKARDANRRFVEGMLEDLPDLCAGPFDTKECERKVCDVRELSPGVSTLPSSSYGSIASVFLHLFRDWSAECEHVFESTYKPAIDELRQVLPGGGDILLPGAGLGRLALLLAAAGYKVEANDASRLFVTAADYLLNRAPKGNIFPLAHVFSENWGFEQQYIEIEVPKPSPAEAAQSSTAPAFVMVPGDFIKTYGKGCVGHRKFDAIVTCFFIDTATDLVELFGAMDDLLGEGGIWVNVGPLNWRKEAHLKLTYDEIVAVWESMGYEFLSKKRIDCDYHMPRGHKMYTESYQGALSVARKRGPNPSL